MEAAGMERRWACGGHLPSSCYEFGIKKKSKQSKTTPFLL
jgi:hypothetical protein